MGAALSPEKKQPVTTGCRRHNRYYTAMNGSVLAGVGDLARQRRSEPEMQITTGQMERWRRVNTASARHLRLSLGGHPFHLVRADSPIPHAVDKVLMNPGDRLDLAVGPLPSGETVVLKICPTTDASASLSAVRSQPCTSPLQST